MRTSKCHPEREHAGLGLCVSCYAKDYRDRTMTPERRREYQRRWRERHPDKYEQKQERERLRNKAPHRKALSRDLKLKWKYGISVANYDGLLAAQRGVCAVCQGDERSGKRFAVDHVERGGETVIRGLLCMPCNVLLGRIEKRPWLLDAALAYIDRTEPAKQATETAA